MPLYEKYSNKIKGGFNYGNIYYETTMGSTQEKNKYRMQYDINKNMLDKRFFLNVKVGDKQYSSELIKKYIW